MRVESRETDLRDRGLAVAREGAFPFGPCSRGPSRPTLGEGMKRKFKTTMHYTIKFLLPATATALREGTALLYKAVESSPMLQHAIHSRSVRCSHPPMLQQTSVGFVVNRATLLQLQVSCPNTWRLKVCTHLPHLTLQLGWSHHARHC